MLLADILSEATTRHPDRPAIGFQGGWRTYSEINHRTDQIAGFLCDLDVRPGDRVAILLPNSPEYVSVHFGVHRAGAVEISLNADLTGEELRRLLEHCEASVLVTSGRLAARWANELTGISRLRHVISTREAAGGPLTIPGCTVHDLDDAGRRSPTTLRPPQRTNSELATIVYTSGVTGTPKGVMLSHLNLICNARAVARYLDLRPDDRMLVVLPFHYIYGRSLLYTHFLTGGALVLENRFRYPATVLDTMEQQSATCFAGVPSTFSILLQKTNLRQRRFPHLRIVTQAGGGMAPSLQREVSEAFAPARLFVMYGSTEAAPRLTYLPPEMLARKPGSIGQAVPQVEIVVANEAGQPRPPGEIGEIAARGANIMLGYWKDPEGTAKVLRDGWYFTGDLGYVDDEGFLFLTGRSKDMIKTGGHRVSANEIEDAIVEIPGVIEASVIGVPDELLGEAIKAFVVSNDPNLTPRDITRELARRLVSHKLPRSIEFQHELPKNSSGKILKSALGKTEAELRPA